MTKAEIVGLVDYSIDEVVADINRQYSEDLQMDIGQGTWLSVVDESLSDVLAYAGVSKKDYAKMLALVMKRIKISPRKVEVK